MILRQIGNNQNLIRFNNGAEILFSYETPVAGYDAKGAFKTTTKYSQTTKVCYNTQI